MCWPCEADKSREAPADNVVRGYITKDIAAWNKKTYTYKHWAYNPWTNWFHSRRVADELKMIERKPKEEM